MDSAPVRPILSCSSSSNPSRDFSMRTALLGCLLSILLLIGCGSPTGFVPVSGKVTMDGKPLDDAHVSFEPNLKGTTPGTTPKNSPGGSYAITDAQGRFRLKRVTDDASGAA